MVRIVIVLLVVGMARPSVAGCPEFGSVVDGSCKPWSAMFLPSVHATTYAPGDAMGTWFGGGLELVLFAWSDSSPAFGPSHGKVRFDAGLLRGDEGAGTMVMYRGGAAVSLEGNPGRRWLIPYVAADLGGLHTSGLGTRGFVDGALGLYVWHQRAFIVDLEGAWVLPFSDAELLAGPRAQLSLTLALW